MFSDACTVAVMKDVTWLRTVMIPEPRGRVPSTTPSVEVGGGSKIPSATTKASVPIFVNREFCGVKILATIAIASAPTLVSQGMLNRESSMERGGQ